jgi:energy-coupling factor transporter transmembrane protein EcfT
MRLFKILICFCVFCLFTAITQIGGIVFLVVISGSAFLRKKFNNRILRIGLSLLFFLVLYFTSTFFLVPFLAKKWGRVPLPVSKEARLRPLNAMTWVLNRHYVRPELKETTLKVALTMGQKYPATTVQYLDANFPFFDGFPLLPHLSHDDGKKLDLSFYYQELPSRMESNDSPSFIGYGICEGAREGEIDMAEECAKRGGWQYSMLQKIISQDISSQFKLDESRTKHLILFFSQQASVQKLFVEPHLVTRWHLKSAKIRFQGCHAVRHDDHVHVQIK